MWPRLLVTPLTGLAPQSTSYIPSIPTPIQISIDHSPVYGDAILVVRRQGAPQEMTGKDGRPEDEFQVCIRRHNNTSCTSMYMKMRYKLDAKQALRLKEVSDPYDPLSRLLKINHIRIVPVASDLSAVPAKIAELVEK